MITRLWERGLLAYLRINVISEFDLFVPDIVVLRERGGDRAAVASEHVLLVGEVIAGDRPGLIDRPRAYAAAGFTHYLVLDCRERRGPGLILHERDGEAYRPVVRAEAGSAFMMTEPFEFAVDPVELVDE
ncbi:hypothetical protein J2S43_005633 [Catenuloplanes nepalensis]|uniref:Restriction endonuclease domain-containing protein n=1 Tax=Catenuloplanes nepalensis TaxID=587533 RepID=A0ABT9N1H3_9ACTN|nr:hypothetical protein [Catenuloplanes nepalensis]MDP9797121.1 hypothetical protein [Catenuloplanes nepalensis]